MSADTASQSVPQPRGLRGWTRARGQTHLYRNGYALIASSGLTSALGLVFWVLAARSYSAVAVGVGSALISAMTTIANLCHLNLKSALNRFLPRAGGASRRLIVRSYCIAGAVSGLVSAAFVAGLHLWSPRLAFLIDRPGLGLWFVLATVAWTIFVLEDNVLTGIRQAVWVPLENVLYALAKLALLPVLLTVAPLLGPFIAWTVWLPLVLLAVNVPLFRWLLPAHVRASEDREERVGARDILRYVTSDYAAYLVMTATIGLLPLVVLATLGARANAYYFVSWSIAYGLYLVAGSMGMSMITEAVHDPAGFARYQRQSLVETAKLVVPCVAVVVLAAPWIMGLLGPGYASAAGLLRLLSLSAVPWIVFVTYTNAARVQRRMRVVVVYHVALFALVLAIGLPLLHLIGIDGLGVGWLAAQSILAVVIVGSEIAHRTRKSFATGFVRMLAATRNRGRRLRHRHGQRAALAEVRRLPGCSEWVIHRNLPVLNDVAISTLGPRTSAPVAVLRRACSPAAEQSLRSHAYTLGRLGELAPPVAIRELVPQIIADGAAGGHGFLVESYLPGRTMETLLRDGADPAHLLASAVEAVRPLHVAAVARQRVNEALLDVLVEVPCARVRRVVAHRTRLRDAVDQLQAELRAAVSGREIVTGCVHGDLSPSNILIDADGKVRGLVDWEQASVRGVPQLDLLQLLIAVRTSADGCELGDVVVGMLRDPAWRPSEQAPASALAELDPSMPLRALTLLAWLQHVSANIAKSARYAGSRLWVRRNIDPVLAAVSPSAAPALGRPLYARVSTGLAAARPWSRLRVARLEGVAHLAALGVAVGLWAVSLPRIDPRAMAKLGLLSVLPFSFVLAFLILTASFVVMLHRRTLSTPLLVLHLLALVAFIHATPTIVYGTLRYEWAWKHVGIVDFIARHGTVDPAILVNGVDHNWPAFFAFITALTKTAGLHDAVGLATWGPVYNNVLYLGALLFLFSGLTHDRRTVWFACWLFFIANWVGQDYFSPQAFAFLLYLLLIGVVIRRLGPGTEHQRPTRAAALGLSVLLLATIAASHALTAVMTCIALTALVLVGVCRARFLPFIAAAFTVLWDLSFAWDFAGRNLASTLQEVNLPWDTTSATLTNVSTLAPDQALVANVARGLSLVIVAIAAAGALRMARAGKLSRAAAILAVVPFTLFATGNYDGEILFRINLFAVPFLAFLAAHAFVGWRRRSISLVLTTAALALILGAFVVSYYGKERINYFTPQEMAAASFIDTHAPPDSLLIDGTNNFPFMFKNYERFTYVSIAREPTASSSRVIAHPVAVLSNWMSNDKYRAAYLILTRSQEIEVEENGVMPSGSLGAIERALLSSPRFHAVFRNRDATVFQLANSSRAVKR